MTTSSAISSGAAGKTVSTTGSITSATGSTTEVTVCTTSVASSGAAGSDGGGGAATSGGSSVGSLLMTCAAMSRGDTAGSCTGGAWVDGFGASAAGWACGSCCTFGTVAAGTAMCQVVTGTRRSVRRSVTSRPNGNFGSGGP